jgi:hypothetical protein
MADTPAMNGGRHNSSSVAAMDESQLDSLSELKRKFKDVLRAYWRQHKANHDGEDTDQYDVAHRIATNIFNLYWDKPNYAGLRSEKKEILNYFVKHIQLSKSREGQSNAPFLRNSNSGKNDSRGVPFEPERARNANEAEPLSIASKKRAIEASQALHSRMDQDIEARLRSESVAHVIPRSPEVLRSIREVIPEQQLACSLLLEGLPLHVPEVVVRSEVSQLLQAQYGVKSIVSTINVGTPLCHILLSTPEECDALAGQALRFSFSHTVHILFRAPYSLNAIASLPNMKKRRGAEMDAEDLLAAKKPKLETPLNLPVHMVPHPYDILSGAMGAQLLPHQASAFIRPNPMMMAHLQQPTDDHFVVERILHQRWVQNKVQYLLQLKGESSTIKVWMFDEDIFAEFEANRKQANLFNAMQTGNFADSSQLPEVEQILGAKMVGSQLMFYVKWSGSSVFAMVPSNIINKTAPMKVIQFYEARLSFEPATMSELASPHMVSSPSSSETISHPASSLVPSTEKKNQVPPLPTANLIPTPL